MRLRYSIFFTLAPWLFYAAGEFLGHLAVGAGVAVAAMLLVQFAGWYRLKWTDWTQFTYFALVVLASTWPAMSGLLAVRPLLAAGLFTTMAYGSLLVGRPFTNQFAMEEVPADYWRDPAFPPHFSRVNRILTFSWALNFSVALVCAWLASRTAHSWLLKGIPAFCFACSVAWTRFFPAWYHRNIFTPNSSAENISKAEV